MSNIEQIAEDLGKLTVIEAAELVKFLEEKWGVSATPAVAAVAAVAQGDNDSESDEDAKFEVTLKSHGENKLNVIKAIRSITGLGLKEAKGIADNVNSVIKSDLSKKESEDVKKEIVDAGGEVDVKKL